MVTEAIEPLSLQETYLVVYDSLEDFNLKLYGKNNFKCCRNRLSCKNVHNPLWKINNKETRYVTKETLHNTSVQ